MNRYPSHDVQKGFFDLGLGLALFAIFATTALVIATDETSGQQEQSAVSLEEHK